MQKKTTYCFLLIALMVMTGCEDMFFREIDFERDTEPEMLVLTGNFMVNQVPQVQVSHSFFFDRTDKRADDWVTDAEVSLSVNGTAYTLSYDSVIEAYTNPTLPRLQALDTIEVTAIHPSYATAIARQVMPAQINSTVVSYEIRPNHCVAFQLDLDTYEGNADDVIAIRAQAEVEIKQTRSYGNGETWTTTQTLQYKTLFSTDILFSEAENLSTEGYYGVNDYNYLYFPSSALNKPRRVSLFLDHYWFGMDEYDSMTLKALDIEVSVCSYSAYRFAQTTRGYAYLPAPSFLPEQEENFMEIMMESLQEMLGNQEPVQVYTNVDGGLGHVAAFCTQVHSFHF
ncbi:MAG: DUF4249 family protein [Paludibacteraceae bacterium]|nr:DUF4249 family protein [Paludibacteraceae bacterium]